MYNYIKSFLIKNLSFHLISSLIKEFQLQSGSKFSRRLHRWLLSADNVLKLEVTESSPLPIAVGSSRGTSRVA